MSVKICAIAAMDEGRVIGLANKLPWHLPADLHNFKELTSGHTVLMGRKTYDSLPTKAKPLPGRINVVLSRTWTASPHEYVQVIRDLGQYLESVKAGQQQLEQQKLNSDKLWILGGEQVYTQSLPYWDMLYLTRVHSKNEGDAFFPDFEGQFELIQSTASDGCTFEVYQNNYVRS